MISSLRTGGRRRRSRIIHLSDLHLPADGRGMAACLERTALEVDALDPDVVIVSGDLTAFAREAELVAARVVVTELSARRRPVIVVPGNRDRFTPGRFEEHFADHLRSDLPRHADASGYPFVRLVGDDLAVVGLDSTRVPAYAGMVFGRLGDDQLARVEALLADPALAKRTVAITAHHAPLDAEARRNPFTCGLIDGGRLLEVTAGKCAALFCGHVHRRYRLAPTAARPEMLCAGSATLAGSEGYWVVEVEDNRVISAEQFVPDLAEGEDRRVA